MDSLQRFLMQSLLHTLQWQLQGLLDSISQLLVGQIECRRPLFVGCIGRIRYAPVDLSWRPLPHRTGLPGRAIADGNDEVEVLSVRF